jgi:hypothetical protein
LTFQCTGRLALIVGGIAMNVTILHTEDCPNLESLLASYAA